MTTRSVLNLYDGDKLFRTAITADKVCATAALPYELNVDSLKIVNSNGDSIDDVVASLLSAQANGSGESVIRADADVVLQANIDAEETARIASDGTLQANIDAEATTRQAQIDAVVAGLTSEATERSAQDVVLHGRVDTEETDRFAADSVLQANITAEETARIAADATLQVNITAEETARIAADSVLQTNITAEETARISADASEASVRSSADVTLQSNIDVEKGRLDALLAGSTIDLDTLQEIIAAYSLADTTIIASITALQAQVAGLSDVVEDLTTVGGVNAPIVDLALYNEVSGAFQTGYETANVPVTITIEKVWKATGLLAVVKYFVTGSPAVSYFSQMDYKFNTQVDSTDYANLVSVDLLTSTLNLTEILP